LKVVKIKRKETFFNCILYPNSEPREGQVYKMKRREMLLEGKNTGVTGSGRGLGKAFAMGLAEAGAKVVVNSGTEAEVASDALLEQRAGCLLIWSG
jgi:phosphoglycerate dehydrogenase-like enzyme